MIQMPWTDKTAPGLMLEITNVCNITCRECYSTSGTLFKSLEQIERDLDTGFELRPVHTVTITGGEPTLHPQLLQIIELIKLRKAHVFLLTNGVLVDEQRLSEFARAGLNSILFHVDLGQERPDLPHKPTFADIRRKLNALSGMAVTCGLDVSISATVYDSDPSVLIDFSDFFFNAPDLSFLFIARGIDVAQPPRTQRPCCENAQEQQPAFVKDVRKLVELYKSRYNLDPYAYIPAEGGNEAVWISLFAPVIFSKRRRILFRIRSNIFDSWLMEVPRILSGRYVHKTGQSPLLTTFRLLVNALSTFRPFEAARFLLRLVLPGTTLRHKMVVYDSGPRLTDEDEHVHCQFCPTAIIREDQLLPCCMAYEGGEIP